jgi:hypothetical protein
MISPSGEPMKNVVVPEAILDYQAKRGKFYLEEQIARAPKGSVALLADELHAMERRARGLDGGPMENWKRIEFSEDVEGWLRLPDLTVPKAVQPSAAQTILLWRHEGLACQLNDPGSVLGLDEAIRFAGS